MNLRYGPAAFRRSSVLEGFERFLKAQNFRGETCVEIGTLKGLTALVRRAGRVVFHEHWEAQQPVMRLVARLGAAGRGVVVADKWALWTA